MKKYTSFFLLSALLIFFLSCDTRTPQDPPEEDREEMTPVEDMVTDTGSIPLPNPCGDEEIDPVTGERRPQVDLIISHVEIVNTEDGGRITPTVKNLCTDRVPGLVEISIFPDIRRDATTVIAIGDIPPQGERVAPTVLIPRGATYTLKVDWENTVPEANEENNICRVSESGRCGG
jgi:hypothetical protein